MRLEHRPSFINSKCVFTERIRSTSVLVTSSRSSLNVTNNQDREQPLQRSKGGEASLLIQRHVEDLRRQPRLLQLRLVKRYRGTRRRRSGDGRGPQEYKMTLLQ